MKRHPQVNTPGAILIGHTPEQLHKIMASRGGASEEIGVAVLSPDLVEATHSALRLLPADAVFDALVQALEDESLTSLIEMESLCKTTGDYMLGLLGKEGKGLSCEARLEKATGLLMDFFTSLSMKPPSFDIVLKIFLHILTEGVQQDVNRIVNKAEELYGPLRLNPAWQEFLKGTSDATT